MKKLAVPVLFFLICMPFVCYATSIGGPQVQGKGKLGVGFEYENALRRKVKFYKTNFATFGTVNAQLKYLNREMFKVSYGLLDNTDIYLKLGAAEFKAESTPFLNPDIYAGDTHLRTKYAPAYGLGLKSIFALSKNWKAGIDLQYIRHKNKTYARTPLGDGTVTKTKGETTIQEWHVAPYISYEINKFLPYAGVRYSGLLAKARAKYTGDWDKSKSDGNIGAFIGTNYKLNDSWVLNFEARFIDETATSVAVSHRF